METLLEKGKQCDLMKIWMWGLGSVWEHRKERWDCEERRHFVRSMSCISTARL